jgi:hypothetical protein
MARELPSEILHSSFVLLRRRFSFERTQVSPFSSLWVFLLQIKPVAALDLPNHRSPSELLRSKGR